MQDGPLFDIRNKLWTVADRAQTAWCEAFTAEREARKRLFDVEGERRRRAPGSRRLRVARLAAARRDMSIAEAQIRRTEAVWKAANAAFLAADSAALTDWNTRRGWKD
jgi:hypothetical protein